MPARKRPRTMTSDPQWQSNRAWQRELWTDALDDQLTYASLYTLPPAVSHNWNRTQAGQPVSTTKRALTLASVEGSEAPDALQELFPELFPRLPGAAKRHPYQRHDNPFLQDQVAVETRHVALRPALQATNGVVNGYIKCVMWSETPSAITEPERLLGPTMATHHRDVFLHSYQQPEAVTRLPSGFGSSARVDATDRKLLKFYVSAICAGRTLLPQSNAWLALASVIDSDECARHAALAFSAGYLLDYVPSEKLRARANFHYKTATDMLTSMLQDISIYENGREDSIVTAMHMMWSDDIVQWELRSSKEQLPRWRHATQIATRILDSSDPGHRYWRSKNVQATATRQANANMCAYAEVCALPVTKLEVQDIDKLYPWLLAGSEEDMRTIYGGTGVSPKVLHYFAQITQLSARIMEDPESIILPHAADEILNRLTDFRQVSELSRGHKTTEHLLRSCVLDDDGLVNTAEEVTELTAETWVQAASIYLCCRFYRLPRSHPRVLKSLSILLRCVERMPTKGELFTAQSPFFCIFMAALVAEQDEDRRMLRNWFDVIVSRASGRSSVPPIYDMIQSFWSWIDADAQEARRNAYDETVPLHEREPWWERMVGWILQNYGQLSLV